jgi:hypothetical protein
MDVDLLCSKLVAQAERLYAGQSQKVTDCRNTFYRSNHIYIQYVQLT